MTATDLESQVEELRGALAAVQSAVASRPRLRLTALEPAPYLGQSVALTAAVTDAHGVPLSGVAVTLVTSWGELYGEDDPLEGGSISALTGPDGTVRATLRPRVSLDDSEEQDALEAVLVQLSPTAASPGDAAAALQSMAAQYRWEANRPYRNAVDGYFRDFGKKLLLEPLARDYMVSWQRIPATVIAFVEAPDQAVAATVTLRFRDWLGAWLQVYSGQTKAQNRLASDFDDVKKGALGASGILAGVLDRAGFYVDNEFGVVGKHVARDTAQNAIGKFLDVATADLSSDVRGAIGPVLTTGSKGLSGVLGVVGETQLATGSKVDRADFNAGLAGKANAADLVAVQTAVGAKADVSALDAVKATIVGKADKSALDSFQAQIGATLASKANAADLQTVQAGLAAKADKAALDSFQIQINNVLATKASVTDLKAVQTAVATKIDQSALDSFQRQITATLASKANVTDLQTVQAGLATKADKTALDSFQIQINEVLATKASVTDLKAVQTSLATKIDQSAFDSFQRQITATLATKASLTDLQVVQAGLTTKTDKTAFDAFQSQINTAIASKANLADFKAFQTATNTSLAAKVDSVTFEGFRRQVNDRLPLTVTRADLDALEARTNTAIAAKADTSLLTTVQTRLKTIETRVR